MFKLFATVNALRKGFETLERVLARHAVKLTEHGTAIARLNSLAPVNLAAEITKLSEQVAALRTTHQRFQGRFDKYVALNESERVDDDDGPDDPRWKALMELQRANGSGGT